MSVEHVQRRARLLGCAKSTKPRARVVVVGGGTGLYTALTGLRRLDVELAAVVSVMDSGGSSGRLREEFGVLPPGDARQCLVALASDDARTEVLRDLFAYRFHGGCLKNGLDGHNLGNLLLTALTEMSGSAETAYAWAGQLLAGQGRVIPVCTSSVQLCARLSDGHVLRGETSIDVRTEHPDATIQKVFLDHVAHATKSAIDTLSVADMVVLGPGDLYTSIIPNLLVEGIADAIGRARYRVLVVNLMTKPGETDGFRASTFVEKLHEYLAPARLDAAVVNAVPPLADVVRRYAAEGAAPVEPDVDAIDRLHVQVIARPLASAESRARHDPAALARALWSWLTAQPLPARAALETNGSPLTTFDFTARTHRSGRTRRRLGR